MRKIDLIMHPVRFRVLRLLTSENMTTQMIADRMADVPKSSLYRHLKLLLEGEAIGVAQTELVNGIQEKTYALKLRPYLGAGDLAEVSAEEHISFFTIYVMTLLNDFANYVTVAAESGSHIDMVTDRTGYTEVAVYATKAELDVLQGDLNTAIMKLTNNPPGNGRQRHKFALITHPYSDGTNQRSD